MLAPETTNMHRAALALHALSATDLQRVWSRLDETQREALSPLLDELKILGIPTGQQWIADDTINVASGKVQSLGDQDLLHAKVWRLQPEQVLHALALQSVDTAATLLQIAAWPWREPVIRHWAAEQRHLLRERLEVSQQVPDKLAQHLLQLLVAETDRLPPSKGTTADLAHARSDKRSWHRRLMSLFMLT